MSELEVAPDYTPDELPHAFEPAATSVVGEGASSPARGRHMTLLREELDARLEHATEYGRTCLVPAARDGGTADGG